MHPQAANWIAEVVEAFELHESTVLDLGGRTVWGNVHGLFAHRPTVLDAIAAPDVDIIADAANYRPDRTFGVVLATEVFEHTPSWPLIIKTAWLALEDGGVFIGTCASRDRPPHSAIDGGELHDGEWYCNVDPDVMRAVMKHGWADYKVIEADGHFGNDDLYCWGVK